MKQYMKHANRGLLLSAVVLVIMIIYIVVDYIQFATQKSAIQTAVTNYVEAVFDTNLENHDNETAMANYQSLVERSFTENYTTMYYVNRSILLAGMEALPKDAVYDISDAKCQIQSMSVKKSGTGGATVSVTYSGAFTGEGDSIVFSPGGSEQMSAYDNMYYEEDTTEAKDYTKDYSFNYQGNANFSMKLENGEWKIASLETSYYNSTFEPVDGE